MNNMITVTGADEKTDIQSLGRLDAEIGLLYTATPEGRNRYPSRQWVLSAARHLKRVALHVCGGRARQELINGELDDILPYIQRIQVNGLLAADELVQICTRQPLHVIITQHHARNAHLLDIQETNHVVLIDASGGKGLSPEKWEAPITRKHVGFAGGLGPSNLFRELCQITRISRRGWWVDMEGKLRVDDWFSVENAEAAIKEFERAIPV